MLQIIIEVNEFYNEKTEEFETVDDVVLELEHSLISLSKWESKYKKSFLTSGIKTHEESFGYLKMMVVTPNVDLDVLYKCSEKNLIEIQEYIESSESATTFGELPERRGPGEVITSELIYYWMVAYNIDFECQYWHLNRLFSLIRICNVKNSKPKKMSRNELAQRNQELNQQRKAALNTTG